MSVNAVSLPRSVGGRNTVYKLSLSRALGDINCEERIGDVLDNSGVRRLDVRCAINESEGGRSHRDRAIGISGCDRDTHLVTHISKS